MDKSNTPKHISYGVLPVYVNAAGLKEYLLLQNHSGYWGFPKGHPELNETPKMTALREANEEAALQLDEDSLAAPVYYDYHVPIAGAMLTKRVVLFPVRVQTKDVTIQHSEIQAFEWATYQKAIALIDLPGIIDLLRPIEDSKLV